MGGFGLVPGATTGQQTERLITALTANADRNTERIIAALEQWQPPVVTAREVVREVRVEPPPTPPDTLSTVSTGQLDSVSRPQTIIDKSTVYARETHPKLFQVIDLLVDDPAKRRLSVRSLAAETGVSKSWCAIARRYWQQQAE